MRAGRGERALREHDVDAVMPVQTQTHLHRISQWQVALTLDVEDAVREVPLDGLPVHRLDTQSDVVVVRFANGGTTHVPARLRVRSTRVGLLNVKVPSTL